MLLSCALNPPKLPANRSQGWRTLAFVFTEVFKSRDPNLEINVVLFLVPLQSQQKCIVIFALLCCFAVLVALIFSAVDIWGEDEDGITEENCSKNCR